jgi:hypothetical protein
MNSPLSFATTLWSWLPQFLLNAIGRRFFIEGTSDLRTWTDRGLVVSSNGETRVQLSSTNDTALFRVRRFEL